MAAPNNLVLDPDYESAARTRWLRSAGCSYKTVSDAQRGAAVMEVNAVELFGGGGSTVGAHGQVITFETGEESVDRNLRWYVRKTQTTGGVGDVKVAVRIYIGAQDPTVEMGIPDAEWEIDFASLSTDWTEYSLEDLNLGFSSITIQALIDYEGGGTPLYNHKVEFDNWRYLKDEEEAGYKTPIADLDYPENGPGPARFRVTEVDDIHGTMHKEGGYQLDHDLQVRDADDIVSRDRDDLALWYTPNRRTFREP